MDKNPNEIVKELDVLDILSNSPCGMTLPEIGNEMGVNWRGLAATISALMSEGSIEKLGNRYYPAGSKNGKVCNGFSRGRPRGTGASEELCSARAPESNLKKKGGDYHGGRKDNGLIQPG